MFIYHLSSRRSPKKYTTLCLCIQDFTQCKPAGPSGVELCSCLNNALQYPAVQRARYFQAEVGAAV